MNETPEKAIKRIQGELWKISEQLHFDNYKKARRHVDKAYYSLSDALTNIKERDEK